MDGSRHGLPCQLSGEPNICPRDSHGQKPNLSFLPTQERHCLYDETRDDPVFNLVYNKLIPSCPISQDKQ
jgi:hypothetical protein